MALIQISDVTLRFPIYGAGSRSLRSSLLSKLGGNVQTHDRTLVVEALNNFSITIQDGDRVGIIGHNGAGKSTLLKVMAGIYPPQKGEVRVEGSLSTFVDITLGMDPDATGWQNIILRGIFLGLTFEQARELTPSVAEFSELGEYLSLPVRVYSAGMFMRLAFAVTTSIHPDIVLMDEMIGAGDAKFLDKALKRITNMLDRTKIVVIASHSEFIINTFCNKVLWMEKGQIRGFGPTEEILQKYSASVSGPEQALTI